MNTPIDQEDEQYKQSNSRRSLIIRNQNQNDQENRTYEYNLSSSQDQQFSNSQQNMIQKQYQSSLQSDQRFYPSNNHRQFQNNRLDRNKNERFHRNNNNLQNENIQNEGKNISYSRIKKSDLEYISTGNRLNDYSKIQNYESKRDGKKINVNSFLNSFYQQRQSAPLEQPKFNKYDKILNQNKLKDPNTLITIPEINENYVKLDYLQYLNRNRKIESKQQYYKSLLSLNEKLKQYENYTNNTFEDAKLKFYNRFTPDSLKIGNNPLKLLKYNKRKETYNRILGFLD